MSLSLYLLIGVSWFLLQTKHYKNSYFAFAMFVFCDGLI